MGAGHGNHTQTLVVLPGSSRRVVCLHSRERRKCDDIEFCLGNERLEDLVQNRFLEIFFNDQNNQASSSSRSIPHLRYKVGV